MTYSRTGSMKKRAHVRLDRFGAFQLGREKNLKALDRWLLVALSMNCDYKTGDYHGTLTDLAGDTGAPRRAVGLSLARLGAEGLVQVVEAFGPNSPGHVRVLALDSILIDVEPVTRAVPREKRPHLERRSRAQLAPNSRATRDEVARIGASAECMNRENAETQGSKEGRVQGDNVSREHSSVVALVKDGFSGHVVAQRKSAS